MPPNEQETNQNNGQGKLDMAGRTKADDVQLPPRLYYSLEQAAKELNCDPDYLIHLGATRRLIFAVRLDGSGLCARSIIGSEFENDPDTEGSGIQPRLYNSGFLIIYDLYLKALEANTSSVASRFYDLLPNPFTNTQCFGSERAKIKPKLHKGYYLRDFIIHLEEGATEQQKPLSKLLDNYKENNSEDITGIEVTRNSLFIMKPEIERLLTGDTAALPQNMPDDMIAPPQDPPRVVGSVYPVIKALAETLAKAKGRSWSQHGELNTIALDAMAEYEINDPTGNKGIRGYLDKASK